MGAAPAALMLWDRYAMIVANEFLESEVCELKQAVSHAFVRGDSRTSTG
jgi:hypothetical protein